MALTIRALKIPRTPLARWMERFLFAAGAALLALWLAGNLAARFYQSAASRALGRTLASESATEAQAPVAKADPHWRSRISPGATAGRMEIPRLGLSAVILEGTNAGPLYLGVGHMSGTALPGDSGQVVLAGHRDSFFRPLKDIHSDDLIRITTPEGVFLYRVTSTDITKPKTIEYATSGSDPALTLITCYPFHYVGSAPLRFIVQATQVGQHSG